MPNFIMDDILLHHFFQFGVVSYSLLIPNYNPPDKFIYYIAPLLTPSLAWAEARDILAGVERKIDCQVLALMPFLNLPDVGIYCKRL